MENETEEKDPRNQQQKSTGTVDPSKKNPSHEGQTPSHQDPSRKQPSQGGDFQKRDGEEKSEQGDKRRAS
jgi:hypothetical protein